MRRLISLCVSVIRVSRSGASRIVGRWPCRAMKETQPVCVWPEPDAVIQKLRLLDQAGIGKSLRRQVVLGGHGASPTFCASDGSKLSLTGWCRGDGADANETRSEK